MGVAEFLERVGPERAWIATAVTATVALVVGSLAFPRMVYDRFVWHYFWGPVFADAHDARCAVMEGDGPQLLYDPGACRSAEAAGRIVAEPGYTVVSEVGYAVVLLFSLVGVLYLVRNMGIDEDRDLVLALVPFMLFGGALRVVEDATDQVPRGADAAISYPANALIISPLIYAVVFLVVLAALVGTRRLETDGVVDRYQPVMAGVGVLVLGVTVGYLAVLGLTTAYVGFHPQMTVVVVVLASLLAGGIYRGLERFAPVVNAGTERLGLAVLWAHMIDGVANYLAADWTAALGIPGSYGAKHPVNRFLNDLAGRVFPPAFVDIVGVAWLFLLVKVVAAVAVLYVFDERVFDESPRYALLLVVAIIAVGLGPGTRDMLRVSLGI
jgi:uncharacterized membrane protein